MAFVFLYFQRNYTNLFFFLRCRYLMLKMETKPGLPSHILKLLALVLLQPPQSPHSKPPSNSNKITERHFTPRTRRLAVASKSHIRNRIVYHESGPFNPMTSRMARLDFAWAAVKEAANNSDDHYLKDAFRRASKNDGIKKNLLTFVSHLLNNER